MTLDELLAEMRTLVYKAQHSESPSQRRKYVVRLNELAGRARDVAVLGVREVSRD